MGVNSFNIAGVSPSFSSLSQSLLNVSFEVQLGSFLHVPDWVHLRSAIKHYSEPNQPFSLKEPAPALRLDKLCALPVLEAGRACPGAALAVLKNLG